MPVDAYETPQPMREVIHLLRPGSVYPFSGNLSRHQDLDHPIPYLPTDRGGPPGQTDPYTLGPLTRFEHRVKTHARGWRHLNPLPGVYLWRTPHGYWFRVDRHGTHPLGRDPDLRPHGIHPTPPTPPGTPSCTPSCTPPCTGPPAGPPPPNTTSPRCSTPPLTRPAQRGRQRPQVPTSGA